MASRTTTQSFARLSELCIFEDIRSPIKELVVK